MSQNRRELLRQTGFSSWHFCKIKTSILKQTKWMDGCDCPRRLGCLLRTCTIDFFWQKNSLFIGNYNIQYIYIWKTKIDMTRWLNIFAMTLIKHFPCNTNYLTYFWFFFHGPYDPWAFYGPYYPWASYGP